MLTPSQVNFAKDHDWFVSSSNGSVMCRDVRVDTEILKVSESMVIFTDFGKLKDWAGY